MPSGRVREFDVEAAVDAALLVFWSRGYEGASMAELVDATGVRRGSLYAAFGSKEGLFRRALRRYADTVGTYVAQALAAPDATSVAETLLRGAVDAGTGERTPSGCLFVQGALSCSPDGEPVRDELAVMRAAGEAALRDRFAELAREGDEVAAATDPDLLAGLLITLRQGLSVKARTGAGRAELHALVDLAVAGPPFGPAGPQHCAVHSGTPQQQRPR